MAIRLSAIQRFRRFHPHDNAQSPAALTSSFRFWRISLPVLLLISTFRGLEISLCLSITRPLAEDSESLSVFWSVEPSTGQNMPQNFCRGWLGLELPMLWKRASPTEDISLRQFCYRTLNAKARKTEDDVHKLSSITPSRPAH